MVAEMNDLSLETIHIVSNQCRSLVPANLHRTDMAAQWPTPEFSRRARYLSGGGAVYRFFDSGRRIPEMSKTPTYHINMAGYLREEIAAMGSIQTLCRRVR